MTFMESSSTQRSCKKEFETLISMVWLVGPTLGAVYSKTSISPAVQAHLLFAGLGAVLLAHLDISWESLLLSVRIIP